MTDFSITLTLFVLNYVIIIALFLAVRRLRFETAQLKRQLNQLRYDLDILVAVEYNDHYPFPKDTLDSIGQSSKTTRLITEAKRRGRPSLG